MVKFYAVAKGRKTGIFMTWEECSSHVTGFSGAIFKSFGTREEAERYLNPGARSTSPPSLGGIQLPLADRTVIYTDGSCSPGHGPGTTAGTKGGYGILVQHRDGRQVRYYGRVPIIRCTNQRAELYAIYAALSLVKDDVMIYTDSEYCINCLTHWYAKWQREGKENIANKVLIEACLKAMKGRDVAFRHVYGHTGIAGNEEADKLANMGRLSIPP